MAEHLALSQAMRAVAPDGSDVRVLLALENLSTARFEFPAQSISVAVRHRTVHEVWHVTAGRAQIWVDTNDEPVVVEPGDCISLAVGEAFQVRVASDEPLVVFGVTTPAWPGAGEAEVVSGRWVPTIVGGPV